MDKLHEMKMAINSLAVRIAEIAEYDVNNFYLNLCLVIEDDVVVVNVGEKKVTVTNENSIIIADKKKIINEKILSSKSDNTDFLSFYESCCNSNKLSTSTQQNYMSTLKYLRDFSSNITFKDVSYKFIIEFEKFLYDYKLHVNTIAKHMKHLKRIINSAINMDLIDLNNYPFRKYHIKIASTEKANLNYEELDMIGKMIEHLSEEEKEIADAFLFSCYTGLRFSDVKNLSSIDFQTINRQKWIVKKMQKTNTEVRIPLKAIFQGKALDILRLRKNRRGKVFKLPANHKTNRILKRLCKKCKIVKQISFHCARHTAATLLLYDGVNISTVQKILGHKSVRQTEVYSAITDNTILKELKKIKRKF